MTIEEQLTFCEKCINRKMDLSKGLICGLTSEKGAFENNCPDYRLDESTEEVTHIGKIDARVEEIYRRLPSGILEKLRLEQNLQFGIIAGLVTGLIGSILWGAITVASGFQIGYMALAIGAGVGFSIRLFGKGIERKFGIIGAGIALLSCLFGNFIGIIGFIAKAENLDFFETLMRIDYSFLPEIMIETFSVIDLLFYGIAIYEGYRFSFRVITEKDIEKLS